MLVNRCNTVARCYKRVMHFYAFSVENDFTAIRLVHPREHLDKSGFPGTIFAHESMDFAFFKVEAHIVKRLNAGEYLGDVVHFQQVFRHGGTP